jgi:putative oxidoreductase
MLIWNSECGIELMDTTVHVLGRFLVTAFFAIVFLQSALDKLLDREGNLSYFRDHFKNSPFPPDAVPLLLTALAALEGLAGTLCALGVLSGSFSRPGLGLAATGVAMSGLALVALLFGQRLAKDYAGAAVVAAYFAVALVGLSLF